MTRRARLGSRDPLCRLGRRHRRSRQRRPSRPLHRHRQRLSRGRAEAAAVSEQDAARGVPQPRRRHVRRTRRGGRTRHRGGTLQPRVRLRRLRQRRRLDVLIVNLNEPPSLLRNDVSGTNNWIKVKLEGVNSNRSAIGARVLVRYGGRTQAQAVVSQSSFYRPTIPACTSAWAPAGVRTSRSTGPTAATRRSRARGQSTDHDQGRRRTRASRGWAG